MALDPGDTACTHGLSKRIHDNMLSGSTGAIDGPALKAFAYAIATAVVTEITTNAVVPATGLDDSGGHACTGSTTVT